MSGNGVHQCGDCDLRQRVEDAISSALIAQRDAVSAAQICRDCMRDIKVVVDNTQAAVAEALRIANATWDVIKRIDARLTEV